MESQSPSSQSLSGPRSSSLSPSAAEPAAVVTAKPKRLEVRGRLRAALDKMVWEGAELVDACRAVEFSPSAMRKALCRPHVLAYVNKERQVLRASIAPKNIHRLREIRDADNNMPAVNAIKVLEQLGEDQSAREAGVSASPGVTIRIVNIVQQSAGAEPHNPLKSIENE